MKSEHPEIIIRKMTIDALPAVVELEQRCGLNSHGIEGYEKILIDPRAILLVAAEESDQSDVVGIFSGVVILDELQIDNIAVAVLHQREGIGKLLLESALTTAARLGACTAILEVRTANLAARTFYEKNGFDKIGFRKQYYSAPIDDALLLGREIQNPVINVS